MSAIEQLFVEIGLDSTELQVGLDKASQAIGQVGNSLEATGSTADKLADTFAKSGDVIEAAAGDASQAVKTIGNTSRGVAGMVGQAMDGIQKSIGNVASVATQLFAPFIAAFAGGQLFSNFSQMGEELSNLSDRTGVAVEKIDAWAKANRDAGGSAEAFKGALESWTVDQGRSAEEFFRLGESVKGMTDTQASFFLQSMGLSQDAAAVFTKFKDTADEAAASYAGVAMTKEQAERAREMNILWRRFTDQVQALGNILAVTVLPVVNAVLDVIGDGLGFITKHARAVQFVLGAIGVLVGGAYLKSVIGLTGGFTKLFGTLKSGGAILAALQKGFMALKAAMLANPIAVVIAAVTALVLVFEDLFAFLKGEGSAFAGLLHWLGLTDKQIAAVRKGILDFFEFLAGIPDKVVAVFETAVEIVTRFGRGISRLWESFDMSKAVEAVKEGLDAIGEFFANLGKKVGDALSSALSAAMSFGQSVKDAIVTGVSDALAWMREAFLSFFGKVGEWVASALDVGGKVKEKYLRDAIAEYSKRLGRYCKLDIIEVADEKTPEHASEGVERQIRAKEGGRIAKHIRPDAYVIALAIDGTMLSSEGLAAHINQLGLHGESHIQLIIGGSIGLDDAILRRADYRLSFSKMTFPHQLMRVILLEQLYRAYKINAGEPYHK